MQRLFIVLRLYSHNLQSSLTSWISTIFSGGQAKTSFLDHGHIKTDFRIQSPSDISVAVAIQLAFCYNRFWGNAFVVPGNAYATVYCYNLGYFLGNSLRRFWGNVSSGFQHVTLC
jgi:hypothetical protein